MKKSVISLALVGSAWAFAVASGAASESTSAAPELFTYYPSFQELTPFAALKQAFPNVPSFTYLDESRLFTDPLSVDFATLGARSASGGEAMQKLTTPITLGGVELPCFQHLYAAYSGGTPVSFESPDQLYKCYLTPEEQEKYADLIAMKVAGFTDSAVADADFFESIQSVSAFNIPQIVVKVTADNIDKLRAVFGTELPESFYEEVQGSCDQTGHWSWRSRESFYFIDTTMAGWPEPHDQMGGTRYAVGTFVLLREERRGAKLPVAISVTMNTGNQTMVTKVFTKESSEDSRWRAALLHAKSSTTQWGAPTHMYSYHFTTGTIQRAMFNTLAADHKLLQALLPFSKYTQQFITLVFGNAVVLDAFPFEIAEGDISNFFPLLKYWDIKGQTERFCDSVPSSYLEANGMDRYTRRLSQEQWSWDTAQLQTDIEKITQKLAKKIAKVLYDNDAEVQSDVDLQAFVTNVASADYQLNGLTSSGEMETMEDMTEFLEAYLYNVMIHGLGRLHALWDLGQADKITSIMSTRLVTNTDDETPYSVSDIMKMLPDTLTAFNQKSFFNFFGATKPYESITETEEPYNPEDETGRELNKAFDRFQNDIKRFMHRHDVPEEQFDKFPMNVES